jgi:hypothetical protein
MATKTHKGEKIAYSLNAVGKLDVYVENAETRSISFTLYNDQLKVQ